jgi:hypothetical protein
VNTHALERNVDATSIPIPVTRFRAPDGTSHTVAVLAIDEGWRIIDQNGKATKTVETLRDPRDEREQAEAVARDYANWAAVPAWARQ